MPKAKSNRGDTIREIVGRVPCGHVCTYGDISEVVYCHRRGANAVASAMGEPGATEGWHRVVNARGDIPKLPGGDTNRTKQRCLLQKEGIEFDDWRVVRLAARLWTFQ